MTEENERKIFCRNFNCCLDKSGLSQIDIAKRLGVSTSAVSTWPVVGNVPRMGKIELLAQIFGVLKSDLIEDKPEKLEKPDNDDELKMALFGDDGAVADEMWEEAKNYALYIKERKRI